MENPSEERIEKIVKKVSETKLYGKETSIKEWIDNIINPDFHYLENTERITGVPSDWRLKDKRNDHLGHPLSHWAKEYCLLKLNNIC
jgi:hypothetical protein